MPGAVDTAHSASSPCPFPSYPPSLARCASALAWTKDARVLDALHGFTSSAYKDIEYYEFVALFLKFLHRDSADFQGLTNLTGTIGRNVTSHMDPGPQNKMLGENPIALPQQDARMHESPGAAIQRQVIDMCVAILLIVLLSDREGKQRQRLANDHGVPAYGHPWSLARSYRDLGGIRRYATRSWQCRRTDATCHALGIRASQVKAHLRLYHRVDGTCDRDLVTFINRFSKLDLRRAPCQPRLAETVDQRIRHVSIH